MYSNIIIFEREEKKKNGKERKVVKKFAWEQKEREETARKAELTERKAWLSVFENFLLYQSWYN